MPFNIETLDDQPIPDGMTSFVGGQVSDSRPTIIGQNAAELMQNMDLSPNGDLTTRRGVSRLGAGLVDDGTVNGTYVQGMSGFYSAAVGPASLIAVNKRVAFQYIGSTWTKLTGYSAGSLPGHTGMLVCIVQGDDSLYFSDVFANIFAWDGTTFTDLGSGGVTEPPFGATSLIWHTNRLVAAGMSLQPDTVAFSDILDATTWDTATQQVNVGKGDGEPIYGIVSWTDFNILVIKRNSIWVINADPSQLVENFTIKPITQRTGSLAWRTFKQVGNDVIGLTDTGVRSVQRTVASETKQDLGPALSFPIADIIRRINKAHYGQCHAVVRNDRWICFVPLDAATECNYAIVWNAITESWSGLWTGWDATCTAQRIASDGSTRMVFGDSHGRAKEWLDYVLDADEVIASFRDDGVEIASRLKTRAGNFNDPQAPKSGLNYEVDYTFSRFAVGGIAAPTVKTRNERGTQIGSTENLTQLTGDEIPDAFDLQAAGQFRALQFDVETTGGKLSVKRVVGNAFSDTIQLQTA